MSDTGFELRPCVSLPTGRTSERASERAVPSPFRRRGPHTLQCVLPGSAHDRARTCSRSLTGRRSSCSPSLAARGAGERGGGRAQRRRQPRRPRRPRLRDLLPGDCSGGSSGGNLRAGAAAGAPLGPETFAGGDGVVAGGAVPAAVARAEAELSDGQRFAVDTVAGERYRGRYAGRLRFFLLSLPTVAADDFDDGIVATRFYARRRFAARGRGGPGSRRPWSRARSCCASGRAAGRSRSPPRRSAASSRRRCSWTGARR